MHPLARISTDDADDLRALESWLNEERELRGYVTCAEAPDHARDLDGVVEVLTVPIGNGAAGVVLASSLVSWLRNNSTSAKVTVVRGYLKVTLDPATMARVLPMLERLLEPDDDSDDEWLS
jgi:hypothetical protein